MNRLLRVTLLAPDSDRSAFHGLAARLLRRAAPAGVDDVEAVEALRSSADFEAIGRATQRCPLSRSSSRGRIQQVLTVAPPLGGERLRDEALEARCRDRARGGTRRAAEIARTRRRADRPAARAW